MVRHKAQDVDSRPRTKDIVLTEEIDFKAMMFPKPILDGLLKSKYRKPSPIQKKALPLVRCGLDLIIQAKAGTGKTLVLALAALETVQPQLAHLQAIVLAPTREIALQVHDVINAIGRYCTGLKCSCFIGGYPLSEDVGRAAGCQVAVGAPGRVAHLLREVLLDPRHVRLFVLDEADKLLEDSYISDINEIYGQLPSSKQVLALSATYTEELISQLGAYMRDGRHCSPDSALSPSPSPASDSRASVLLGVRQFASVLPDHANRLARLQLKEKRLLHLLKSVRFDQCFIFSNLHSRAASLCHLLNGQGLSADWIAGRQEQERRVRALDRLRSQRVRVLVTTDLAARGIDAEHVDLVVNMDVPYDGQTYLHRMGRAGRYGAYGIVITLVHDGEELEMFQNVIGSIGGTSMSVSCVPSNLNDTNLWTIPVEALKKIQGTVEEPTNDEQSGTDNSGCNDEQSDTENTGINGKVHNGQLMSVSSKHRHKDSHAESGNLTRESSKKTSKISTNHTNENDISNSFVNEVLHHNFHSLNEPKEICNIKISTPYIIDKIFQPSLFSLAGKEDGWRDVFPVIINESLIPLNVPVTLLGSKVIRVKQFHEKQSDQNPSFDGLSTKVVEFESNPINNTFLTYDEIEEQLTNGVSVESYLTSYKNEALDFETVRSLLNKEADKYEIGEKVDLALKVNLAVFTCKRKCIENKLISFDHFDLVGWMAVDETLNLVESLNVERHNIYKFKLIKCPIGESHIKPIIAEDIEINEDRELESFIVGLNLKNCELDCPRSLQEIAEKIALNEKCNTESITTNLLNGEECENYEYCNEPFQTDSSLWHSIAIELNRSEQSIRQLNTLQSSREQKPNISENFFYRNYPNNKSSFKSDIISDKSQAHQNKYQDAKKTPDKKVEKIDKNFGMKNYNNHERCLKNKKHKTSKKTKSLDPQRLSETGLNSKGCRTTPSRKYQLDSARLSSSEDASCSDTHIHSLIQTEKTWEDLHDFDESDSGPSDDVPCSPLRYDKVIEEGSSPDESGSDFYEDFVAPDRRLNKSKKEAYYTCKDNSQTPTSIPHKDARNWQYFHHVNTADRKFHPNQSSKSSNNPCSFYHPPSGYMVPESNHYPGMDAWLHDVKRCRIPKYHQHLNNEEYVSHNSHQPEEYTTPHTNHYHEYFSQSFHKDGQNQSCADVSNESQGFHESGHPHEGASYGSFVPSQTLQSENLAHDWYSKWYMKVRQKAQLLEYTEYIRTMATSHPYW